MASKKPVPRSSSAGPQESESFEARVRTMLENAFALYAAKLPLATPEIHDGVRSVVADAKGRGVHAEHLIIELKRACYSADSAAHQKSEVVSTLVTMCIREYYGTETESPEG